MDRVDFKPCIKAFLKSNLLSIEIKIKDVHYDDFIFSICTGNYIRRIESDIGNFYTIGKDVEYVILYIFNKYQLDSENYKTFKSSQFCATEFFFESMHESTVYWYPIYKKLSVKEFEILILNILHESFPNTKEIELYLHNDNEEIDPELDNIFFKIKIFLKNLFNLW